MNSANLSFQDRPRPTNQPERLLVIGEVLWDVFPTGALLGGAPLNFAVHSRRLGHDAVLVSAVGKDERGRRAKQEIAALGLGSSLIQEVNSLATGSATIEVDGDGQPRFVIHRPAAYDAVEIHELATAKLTQWGPDWLYYGTLFPSLPAGRTALWRLMDRFPETLRLYDINLRPGCESPALVRELIMRAHVVKLNDAELAAVAAMAGLPAAPEPFCRCGRDRYGWLAVAVTRGARGCAILVGDDYVEVDGHEVKVVDTVGAGDAFAAAFVHGLSRRWPPAGIAALANRVGALVASRPGAIPDWSIDEVVTPDLATDAKA